MLGQGVLSFICRLKHYTGIVIGIGMSNYLELSFFGVFIGGFMHYSCVRPV